MHLHYPLRVVTERPDRAGSVSSFQALMVSTASRVGTGNIIGVSVAICIGGYGAGDHFQMTKKRFQTTDAVI